jgi:hypothetical protein
MDASYKIDSKSLKEILSDAEALIKSKIDLIDKESFKNFSLFTPLIDNKIDSLIIKDQTIAKLFLGMLPPNIRLELLFRASRDGFKAVPYHQKVDNQGPHVVLIKSKDHNQIFGASTDISQTSSGSYKAGNGNTFLFKYTQQNQFQKLKCKNK